MVCASRPAARLLRTAAPFELPGWYFGTTRPIIRLVVQRIIRLVVYYQPKADNPAGNPAVSFVVHRVPLVTVERAVLGDGVDERANRRRGVPAHRHK